MRLTTFTRDVTQALGHGVAHVHPARGFACASSVMALTRPTPPCGG